MATLHDAVRPTVDPATLGEPGRLVYQSLKKVEKWVRDHSYEGYEPVDALTSPLRRLTFGNLFLDRLLIQAVLRSPVNLRPVLGIRPLPSTKGRGYMAAGYLLLYKLTREPDFKDSAIHCLEWLMANKSPRFETYSWANHYDYASRGGRYGKHDSIIVWTALIGHVFLDGWEVLGESRFFDVANSSCRWILSLSREVTDTGTCLSYNALEQSSIHNANMLGAGFLARAAKHTGSEEYRRVARSAMEYSCSRQLPDGSWWYAEEPKYHWIDNFHTGYNLDSLQFYLDAAGDEEFRPNLEKGLAFYKNHFFEDSGRPKYYHTRTYPVDIQCAAQAIDTLALFSERDPACLELAQKVAAWTVRNMQDPEGYFYYRQYPLVKVKIPMLHWGQATMFKALAHLLLRLKSAETLHAGCAA